LEYWRARKNAVVDAGDGWRLWVLLLVVVVVMVKRGEGRKRVKVIQWMVREKQGAMSELRSQMGDLLSLCWLRCR